MNPQDTVQGSDEWKLAKLGKFSASRLGDLTAKGQGKTRAGYILEIVAERLSGMSCGFEGNADTEFGTEQEPISRRFYEDQFSCFVEQVGFVPHPALATAGASPDGIILDVRGLELKAHRKPITHLKAIEGEIPKDHLYQCQFGMSCTGLPEWHYGNWCPFMPDHLKLHIRTVKRDDSIIAELVVAIRDAEIEAAALVAKYMKGAKA